MKFVSIELVLVYHSKLYPNIQNVFEGLHLGTLLGRKMWESFYSQSVGSIAGRL